MVENKRAYDKCKAKTDIQGLEDRLDKGADKIKELCTKLEENNAEIMTNSKWDKWILAIGILSLCINLVRG